MTDWDADGDLDVWQTNRSAPRVRLLLNQLPHTAGRFIQLQLRGVQCNRDAIGARVTIALRNGRELIRSLRAGEGYLAQSSKILHFGLPQDAEAETILIQWPDNSPAEILSGLEAGHLYRIVQGRGVQEKTPRLGTRAAGIQLAESSQASDAVNSSIRLIPHAKLPLPDLPVLRFSTPNNRDTESANLLSVTQPTLVVLWATWCQPCLHEIRHLTEMSQTLDQAGLHVILVNVDEKPQRVRDAAPSFVQVAATPAFLDGFDVVQRVLAGRERDAALPTSFLIDSKARLLALYKGPLPGSTVLEDLALTKVEDQAFRDHAIPHRGRWLISSMPTDLLSIPERLLELRQTEAAHAYLERHVTGKKRPTTREELPSLALTLPMVSAAYEDVASQFIEANAFDRGKQALIRALQYQPRSLTPRADLAMLYQRTGDYANAAKQFRQVLQLDPQHLPARNSLAWLLATAPQAEVRRPEEAEQLAKQVCEATQHAMPEPLDTLAAAQAAQGRFQEAIATLRQALTLAEQSGASGIVRQLRGRLTLFQKGTPFRMPIEGER